MSQLWRWILEVITLLGVLVMGSLSLFAFILIHAISRPYNHYDPGIFVPQLPPAEAIPPHFISASPRIPDSRRGCFARGFPGPASSCTNHYHMPRLPYFTQLFAFHHGIRL